MTSTVHIQETKWFINLNTKTWLELCAIIINVKKQFEVFYIGYRVLHRTDKKQNAKNKKNKQKIIKNK